MPDSFKHAAYHATLHSLEGLRSHRRHLQQELEKFEDAQVQIEAIRSQLQQLDESIAHIAAHVEQITPEDVRADQLAMKARQEKLAQERAEANERASTAMGVGTLDVRV